MHRPLEKISVHGEKTMKRQGKPETNKKAEDIFYVTGLILAAAGGLFWYAYQRLGFRLEHYIPPCIFRQVTGYYCPGCGGTRAVYALFSGHLIKSFYYQPFVLYAVVVGGCFLLSQTVERLSKGKLAIGMRYRDCYLWIALTLIAINFLVKNMALL